MNKSDIERYLQLLGQELQSRNTTGTFRYWWHRYTSTESFQRILNGEDAWIAVGDFLDEWKREEREDRVALIANPLPSPIPPDIHQWAAFFAAMVDTLCIQDNLPIPEWTADANFVLTQPWFLYPSWRLRPWQLATTPPAFKKRNIFGGDRILDRA